MTVSSNRLISYQTGPCCVFDGPGSAKSLVLWCHLDEIRCDSRVEGLGLTGDEWSGLLIGLLFWSCGWTLWQAQTIKLMTACYSLHSNIQWTTILWVLSWWVSIENPKTPKGFLMLLKHVSRWANYILFASQCFKRDCQIFQPKPRKSAPERPTQECCLQYKQSCCGPGKCLASACRTQRTKKWINHKSKGVLLQVIFSLCC